jgi:uncharacterized protein DUF2516
VFGAYTPLNYFFWALAIAAFLVEGWAFIDAITRPADAYPAAGKQTKPLWLVILGVAFVLGLAAAVGWGGLNAINFLAVAAFVAAAIYLTDVRPKVREFKKGTRQGPYGPW